ncbi:MAG: aminotransferase class V-fold PLP-dependent enzyme [Planctomycetes bacterium]|nr:aminotransferase class V-fold PLP-dependent enzyme [Planctomycetota bacterium]
MSETRVYLDHAATTPTAPEVIEASGEAAASCFGNPSSSHRFGREAKRRLEDAREFLRGSVGASRLVLCSGGTEADLLGVVGAAFARAPGRVLVGASDHPAVRTLRALLATRRHELVEVPVTEHGDVAPETLFDRLGADVRVVAILHGHNELGTLPALAEQVELVRRVAPEAHVHVDLVQAYGKLDFDLDLADVDSVAVSAHKLNGPRGVGFLALSSKAQLAALHPAGGQEDGLRGGTENVAGAVGFACAAELALTGLAQRAAHTAALAALAFDEIASAVPGVTRLGHPTRRLPHILSLRLPGLVGQSLQQRCDERGVAFSVGAACHGSGDGENPVLRAIGLERQAAREVIRLSFGATTTRDEVLAATRILVEEARALLAMAPRRERTAP